MPWVTPLGLIMISGYRPGYLDGRWTSWITGGVQDKADATQLPLPSWLHAFLNADPAPEGPAEGGEPPVMLAALARKHRQAAHRSPTHGGIVCQEIPIARWAALGDENGWCARGPPTSVRHGSARPVKRLTLESPPFGCPPVAS
jgi:hypothetical protein